MYNMIQLYAWDSTVTSLEIYTLYSNLLYNLQLYSY